MPKTIEIPTSTTARWQELREGLKACIEAVATTARVYSVWPLKYDLDQTITLLQSKKDSGRIHAWIIGISSAEPEATKAGGYYLEWVLNVRIWGFLGYEYGAGDDNTQNLLEEEARKVAQVLYLNHKHFSLDNTEGLKTDGLLVFSDIDVHGFGDGYDVHIAQGNLEVRIGETVSPM